MHKHSSPTMQLTTRAAASRLRQLLDEFHLLMVSFPDLRDAFDADELPLAFILRRDSRSAETGAELRRTSSPRADDSVRPRAMSPRTPGRGNGRKQTSDE